MPLPLLVLSDAPTAPSGLGRITRDLAVRIHEHLGDVFRVATLGYAGSGSRSLPFQQYSMQVTEGHWQVPVLPEVWQDFAGGEPGILLAIWDASRLRWLAHPETCCPDPLLRNFLKDRPFHLATYTPIDAAGPNRRLSCPIADNLAGFDTILAYSRWARNLIERSLGVELAESKYLDWLPHGIDSSVFYPRDKAQARREMKIADDECLIGIVATNQPRKDFGLGIAAVAEIAKSRKVRLHIHTDRLEFHWSISSLLQDYSLLDKTTVTLGFGTDDAMASLYSACDVTLGIGLGEGFGYCIFESLFCGTPCIHGDYGGAAEHMGNTLLCQPDAFRTEGPYNSQRPVFSPAKWALRATAEAAITPALPTHLDWMNLWPLWAAWLRKLAKRVEPGDAPS